MLHYLIFIMGCMVLIRATELKNNNFTDVEARQMPSDSPCNCYFQDSCGCVCENPISWTQFQILPQNFVPCRSFTLSLRGGTFHSFSGDYFYRVGYVQDFVLDVSRVDFQYLNDPDGESSPYNGVTFAISAFLRFHEISVERRWNWGALYWLAPSSPSSYCEIQVVRSSVPVLRADFGHICQGSVSALTVVSSQVVALDNRVFAPFLALVEADLSDNNIVEMKRSYFSYPAKELEVINLSNNNIRTLPSDMFTQMPSLRSVHLRGNPIAQIDGPQLRPSLLYAPSNQTELSFHIDIPSHLLAANEEA